MEISLIDKMYNWVYNLTLNESHPYSVGTLNDSTDKCVGAGNSLTGDGPP